MTTLSRVISDRFGGRLYMGQHLPDDRASILEAASVARGLEWTDSPKALRCFNIRSLNNAPWSTPERRAEYMIHLYSSFEGSLDWPSDRQRRVAERIAIRTVNRIVGYLPGLSDAIRERCRFARTLGEAQAAAKAAEAANDAAWAAVVAAEEAALAAEAPEAEARAATARTAARAAAWATHAVAHAADDADSVLIAAVNLWMEAAAIEA